MRGASVIKCCYAATGMYMTAAAALRRASANTRTVFQATCTKRTICKAAIINAPHSGVSDVRTCAVSFLYQ